MLQMNQPPKTERCHLAPYFLLKLISYAHIKKKKENALAQFHIPSCCHQPAFNHGCNLRAA